MERLKFYLPIVAAVLIGVVLQGILILADCQSTPGKAAVEFAKAYYRVDPELSSLLCAKSLGTEAENVVETYIRSMTEEARDRGVGLNNLTYILYHIETHTRRVDESTAEVRLSAKRRVSINPLYALVAKFFLIGETHQVNEVLTVVKEEGRWKVCGNPFSLIKS